MTWTRTDCQTSVRLHAEQPLVVLAGFTEMDPIRYLEREWGLEDGTPVLRDHYWDDPDTREPRCEHWIPDPETLCTVCGNDTPTVRCCGQPLDYERQDNH